MGILALGISFRSAPIELLDRLAFDDDALHKAYRRARDLEELDEAVILSTCNRVEVYGAVGSYHGGFLALKRLLCEGRDVDPDRVAEPLYAHWEEQAAEHLARVAAGLDSMVLGEPQILSQVREAHRRAREEGAAGPGLAPLFQAALRAGRRVRAETAIGAAPDAFVAAGADLAEEWLGGLVGRTAVVVGAGRMSSLAVRHLRARGVARVRVLNRNVDRARRLAERAGAEPGDLARLPAALAEADLAVSATGATGIVIDGPTVARALAARPSRPLFVLDLAVPRDVDPAVASLAGVRLADLEALRGRFAERERDAAGELERARAIVAEEVRRFQARRRAERVAPLIAALRERGERAVAQELARFRSRLAGLEPEEREAVEALARGIVAKLLHEPIVRLKELSAPGTDLRHARLLAELFGLEPPG
ncbi:MAG TPA: glutamyl-tRNA reductase [Actinomycetota bacterium]|nr:glutamyl-tRNA reductase [Actinomycetota bacterium]